MITYYLADVAESRHADLLREAELRRRVRIANRAAPRGSAGVRRRSRRATVLAWASLRLRRRYVCS